MTKVAHQSNQAAWGQTQVLVDAYICEVKTALQLCFCAVYTSPPVALARAALATWSSGMVLPQGGRSPGCDSQSSPICHHAMATQAPHDYILHLPGIEPGS